MFNKDLKKETKIKIFVFILLLSIISIGTIMYILNNTKNISALESEASSRSNVVEGLKVDFNDINVKASSTMESSSISYAFDGDFSTSWNSGKFAPSWIQLDFKSPIKLSQISLNINQFPSGNTKHIIMGGNFENQLEKLDEIESSTSNGDWIDVSFSSIPEDIRYIRIITEQSPSWISWNEIQIYSVVEESVQIIQPSQLLTEVSLDQDLLINPCVKLGETPTVLKGDGLLNQSFGLCESDSFLWTLGLQSESGYGDLGNCNGFPAVNSSSTPVTFAFLDSGNGTSAASLSMNLDAVTHPCGSNYFTWYMLMHQDSDTIYPLPTELISSHRLFFTKSKKDGASRLIAAISGFTKTTEDADPQPFSIEVALNIDEEWGDSYPESPYISYCSFSECGSNHIFLDGSYFGLEVKEGIESTIIIPWHEIYSFLVESEVLPKPYISNGAYLSTGGVSVGYEVNNFNSNNSYKINLLLSEFKISKKN